MVSLYKPAIISIFKDNYMKSCKKQKNYKVCIYFACIRMQDWEEKIMPAFKSNRVIITITSGNWNPSQLFELKPLKGGDKSEGMC